MRRRENKPLDLSLRSFDPPHSLPNSIEESASSLQFRERLDNLLTMADQIQRLRAGLAKVLGVSEPQYRLIWAIAELQGTEGVTVTSVAQRLRVTGAFVTTEVAKLCRLGFVSKRANPVDGRSVLLRLLPIGERALMVVAEQAQHINDAYFHNLSADEFTKLSGIVGKLIVNGEAALRLVEASASVPPSPIGLLGRAQIVSKPKPELQSKRRHEHQTRTRQSTKKS